MSLPQPFTLEVSGRYVAAPYPHRHEVYQATVGEARNAAVLTLKDGYVSCGAMTLGRWAGEADAPGPRRICWMPEQRSAFKWEVWTGEDHEKIISTANSRCYMASSGLALSSC
jgi:hypothetical protein